MRHRARISTAAALALLASAARAEDGVGAWVAADEAEARLVSAVAAVAPGVSSIPLGLHLRIAEGWRIYWRTPGAAGMPPQFDWSASVNLDQVTLGWPAPRRFEAFGQQSYGYTGELIFPIVASLLRPGEPLGLRLALTYLICREVCMPGEATVALDLGAGEARPTSAAAEIARHAARVPAPAERHGVAIEARASSEGLVITARGAEPFVAPDLFVEWPLPPGQRRPDLPKPTLTLTDGAREARFRLGVHAPLIRPGTALTVTLIDGARALEAVVTVAPAWP